MRQVVAKSIKREFKGLPKRLYRMAKKAYTLHLATMPDIVAFAARFKKR